MKNKSKKIINAKKNNILVTVTMDKPIDVDSFQKLNKKHQVKSNKFSLRAYSKTGEKFTIGGRFEDDGSINKDKINLFMTDLDKSIEPKIIDFCAEVNYNNLESLSEDADVYLVDVSADQFFEEYNQYKINIHSLYWDIEQLKQ